MFRKILRPPNCLFDLSKRTYAPKGLPSSTERVGKNLFKESPEYVEDPEGFGDFESDFFESHKSHKQYERELAQRREQTQLWVVKNKYFKEKQPNFLTYAEKEQIKLLASRDPEEWTSEKLAESFPADLATIEKVIRAKWVARSEKRIKMHDQSVMRNWEQLRMGKLDNEVKTDLKEHLKKFLGRNIKDLTNIKSEVKRIEIPKPKTAEFSSIITSCKKSEDDPILLEDPATEGIISKNANSRNRSNPGDRETFLLGKIVDKRNMRFRDVQENLLQKERSVEENNKEESTSDSGAGDIAANALFMKRFESKEIVVGAKDMKTFDISPIKERIHIPRKLWKRGATYKMEDCYYDDDGEFLYRVPGMTGKKQV